MKTSNRTYNQKQQDATGTQEFDYGNMGEVIENRHTYVVPYNSEPITLKTIWYYDSWNRVREIIYPDGEKVSYHYNKGGLLKSMEGDKNGYTTQYIRDIQYDHYDQRVFMEYGNGVTYGYNYNPETRRLDNLYSESTQQGITLQKNEYKYDNVGNILQIKGYGTDPFEHNYNYDASYRLENANGNGTWQGNNLTYEQSFAYSPSGRIDNKNTTSQKLSNQFGLYNEDYDNTYTYDVNDNPYAVRHITDNTNGLDYDFSWDKKGNMIYASNTKRTLCWTEDNRLQAVKDNQMGAYYNYDASGERNLKLTGAVVQMSQNGVPYDYVILESPTLYASGLITINERGYTKHYFEENKRVCSNIGGGFRDAGYDIMEPIELITPFEDQWTNAKEGIFNTFDECIKSKLDLEKSSEKIVQVMKDHEKDRNEEEYQFYYTNDHLGSSTYITDQDGNITQTLAYLPYGELRSNREYLNVKNQNSHEQHWVDLDNHPPYITPYKFNGKEKDQETGYNYYGARYYTDKLSIWLSVDPLSDKYPSTSSYAYCRNNPINLIDPNGMNDYGWEINHQEKTITKINNAGGDQKQFTRSDNGFMFIKEESTSDFMANAKKEGYTVDNKSGSALEYAGLGLTFLGGITDRASNVLGTVENSYKGMQAQSDALGWGLDYSKEIGKVGKIGSAVSKVGTSAGLLGVTFSGYQLISSKTFVERLESGMDTFMGGLGLMPHPVAKGISLYWGTIGKPLQKMHAKTITEQMRMGINPGLPAYQPFK